MALIHYNESTFRGELYTTFNYLREHLPCFEPITDMEIAYVSNMIAQYLKNSAKKSINDTINNIAEVLDTTANQSFVVYAHYGNTYLLLTGMFRERYYCDAYLRIGFTDEIDIEDIPICSIGCRKASKLRNIDTHFLLGKIAYLRAYNNSNEDVYYYLSKHFVALSDMLFEAFNLLKQKNTI